MSTDISLVNQELAIGHRQRLRSRFVKAPIRTTPDYELLEMILFHAIARSDTKELAKRLLQKFGSLIAIISADQAELKSVLGVGDAVVFQMKLLFDLFSRLHIPIETKNMHVLNNWNTVLNYCSLTMGFKPVEVFRVLFLNKKNILIAEELFDSGTIDKISVYPREIVKHAIYHNAAAVILVHNHPSGDINPSKEDIEVTQKIVHALSHIGIAVHDHLIIAKQQHFSFRSNCLL